MPIERSGLHILLRQRVQEQAQDLKVQFTRIAEIQATLDEERISDIRSHTPVSAVPFPADRAEVKSQA